jgi:hypothetical protein
LALASAAMAAGDPATIAMPAAPARTNSFIFMKNCP